MSVERIIRWFEQSVSDRASLLTVPTALVVDTKRRITAPEIISLEEWRKNEKATPTKAVAFLSQHREHLLATIVDAEHRTIAARVWFMRTELGLFCDHFLLARGHEQRRTVAMAPDWLSGQEPECPPRHAVGSEAVIALGPQNEKPPDPPNLQLVALATLGEETNALLELPVRGTVDV